MNNSTRFNDSIELFLWKYLTHIALFILNYTLMKKKKWIFARFLDIYMMTKRFYFQTHICARKIGKVDDVAEIGEDNRLITDRTEWNCRNERYNSWYMKQSRDSNRSGEKYQCRSLQIIGEGEEEGLVKIIAVPIA